MVRHFTCWNHFRRVQREKALPSGLDYASAEGIVAAICRLPSHIEMQVR